jgi:acyl-coenzyme A synthetase/AMP-(fatty) acid ligase
MNIVEPILFQAKINPNGIAICTPGTAMDFVTYAGLARVIDNIGQVALAMGLVPGNIVAIYVSETIFHAALVLGLARLGIVTVSPRTPRLPKELGVDAVIASGPAPFENAGRTIFANSAWMLGDGKSSVPMPVQSTGDEDVCRIMLTSGSTGEAKAIRFTHRNVQEKIARNEYAKGTRVAACTRLFCDLGITTGPAFRYLIFMLSRGGTIYYFGASSESTIQAFDLYDIQTMITTPSGLSDYVKFYESQTAFRCNLENIVSSGGLLPRSLSERALGRMCAHLYSSYGATETGTIALAPAQMLADIPGAVGFVTPGACVEIVDDADNVLASGKEGIVRTQTAQMVDGYVGNPEATSRAFRNGWFYPGDIGSLTADGMLIIRGRNATVLNLGGDKVKPELVEEALMGFSDIEQAAVFTHDNQLGVPELWAAIVCRSATFDSDAMRAHCAHRLGRAFAPRHIVRVDSLPRSAADKLDRLRLPEIAKRNYDKISK